MMKFYQENKVNPFGSCLPLLMQMPVFISLFYMLRADLKRDICGNALTTYLAEHPKATLTGTECDTVAHGSAKFLFVPDLTAAATGGTLVALLVMYVASQLASSLLMSVTADKNQRIMMLALPFVFVLFVRTFPAGLLVYWITTNVWTVGQQYLVRRTVGHIGPPPDSGAKAEKPKPSGEGAKQRPGRPAPAAAAASGGGSSGPPPRPPRKKKKRSGRRR
jgi:YidC/Oxa1 family membrane protein insertase